MDSGSLRRAARVARLVVSAVSDPHRPTGRAGIVSVHFPSACRPWWTTNQVGPTRGRGPWLKGRTARKSGEMRGSPRGGRILDRGRPWGRARVPGSSDDDAPAVDAGL